jgi:hypothetical protein
MAVAADVSMDRQGSLLLPFALSLFMHALLLLLFVAGVLQAPKTEEQPFQVEIVQPQAEPPPSAQAMAPPSPSAEKPEVAPPVEQAVPPRKTRSSIRPTVRRRPQRRRICFSDRDSKALEEMVKRGEPAPPAKPPQERAKTELAKPGAKEQQLATKAKGAREGSERATDAVKSEAKASTPATRTAPTVGLSDLFVRPSELAKDPMLRKGEDGDDSNTSQGTSQALAALSRPELWADPGQRGTPDYLPDVKQGNFTLLNTKADRFAPFVRRVGMRVFQSFSMEFKQRIYAGSVPQGRDERRDRSGDERGRPSRGGLFEAAFRQSLERPRLTRHAQRRHLFRSKPAGEGNRRRRTHSLRVRAERVGLVRARRWRPNAAGAHWIMGVGLL